MLIKKGRSQVLASYFQLPETKGRGNKVVEEFVSYKDYVHFSLRLPCAHTQRANTQVNIYQVILITLLIPYLPVPICRLLAKREAVLFCYCIFIWTILNEGKRKISPITILPKLSSHLRHISLSFIMHQVQTQLILQINWDPSCGKN